MFSDYAKLKIEALKEYFGINIKPAENNESSTLKNNQNYTKPNLKQIDLKSYSDKVGAGFFGTVHKNPETNRVIKKYFYDKQHALPEKLVNIDRVERAVSNPERTAKYWNKLCEINGLPEYATAKVVYDDKGIRYLDTPFIEGRNLDSKTNENDKRLLEDYNRNLWETHKMRIYDLETTGNAKVVKKENGEEILVPIDIDFIKNNLSQSFCSTNL